MTSASPSLSAIREEFVHLHPWESSLAMRARMQNLGEDKLARCHELARQQKLAMHVDRLFIDDFGERRNQPVLHEHEEWTHRLGELRAVILKRHGPTRVQVSAGPAPARAMSTEERAVLRIS